MSHAVAGQAPVSAPYAEFESTEAIPRSYESVRKGGGGILQ